MKKKHKHSHKKSMQQQSLCVSAMEKEHWMESRWNWNCLIPEMLHNFPPQTSYVINGNNKDLANVYGGI